MADLERIYLLPAGFDIHLWVVSPEDFEPYEYIRADLVPQWRPIEKAPKGRDESGQIQEVLLIGPYPGGDPRSKGGGLVWSNIVHSWYEEEEGWARWEHSFGPTHFMILPKPPEDK